MPNRLSHVLTACALILGPGAAWAQTSAKPAGATSVAPVTVEGAAPKAVHKEAQSYVDAYTVPTAKIEQIGRWREPICVQVVNLPAEQAAVIRTRVEEVAKDLGVLVRPPGCTSNIQIVLTGQPQAFVDTVAKNNEHALGFHYPSDLKKAKTVTHPIQGWYKTATQGSKIDHDGLPFAYTTGSGGVSGGPGEKVNDPNDPTAHPQGDANLPGEVHYAEIVDLPENGSPPGCAGSLINHCMRSVFKNVLVVVDAHAVEGKSLGALADYVTMMSLSQAKSLDGCSALPSIMDLMAKSPCPRRDPPDQLTAADASFLTALYASNPEASAASEQVDIAGRMSETLVKASTTVQASK